jgi:ABC-type branched-subunit amino acid transport system substrate-binding protein
MGRGNLRLGFVAAGAAVAALIVPACSGPDLGNTTFSCTTNADCLGGRVCGVVNGAKACVAPSTSAIRVGMSAPLQGPSQALGIEMRRGIEALFKNVNDQGGVLGRQLELDSMNDNYDPTMALANVNQLLDIQMTVANPDMPDVRGPNSVLALLGNVGTPTMLVTAPVANKNGVVFFAPFTGAQKYLRDGTDSPYVFNYRAGYYEETEAMVDYLSTFRTPRVITGPTSYAHILTFTQHDTYGDAGYNGLVIAYNKLIGAVPQPDSTMPNPSIVRLLYERDNVASVDPAITQAEQYFTDLLAQSPTGTKVSVAVVMIDTYQPGNKFVRAIKDWINADLGRATSLDVLYIHVSFVGSDSLAQALISAPESYADITDPTGQRKIAYADGVMVTQVVPYYKSQAPGVTAYRNDIAKYDSGVNTFTSLEGYIAARLFVEALKANGPVLTDATLTNTLNTQMTSVDIGIGTVLGFTSIAHQACHTVWGSRIAADGSFTVPFIWDPTNRIVPGSN